MSLAQNLHFGAKTLNLEKLLESGFKVPKFEAIAAEDVQKIMNKKGEINEKELEGLVSNLLQNFVYPRYAVRSSALIEDTAQNSLAGQFMTKIDVDRNGLEKAIIEVTKQAFNYLKGDLSKFSIIIQEYIKADLAGVTFTRNPMGKREMVIEYHEGTGEELVSGAVKPNKLFINWTEKLSSNEIPGLNEAFEQFKRIERIFNLPQDIEWCIQDGILYFLQSRPITTFSKEAYKEAILLDETLPKNSAFYYQKTEISEIAPRPTPITLAILEKIYADAGPVDHVYAKFGIKYIPKDFLKVIGNELYIDREAEIQTLLPCMSYLKKNNYNLSVGRLAGLLNSMQNFWKLNRINTNKADFLFAEIKNLLQKKHDPTNKIERIFDDFFKAYELIFEINLLTGKLLKRLEMALKRENIAVSQILAQNFGFLKNFDIQIEEEKIWFGNALEIADENPFIANKNDAKKIDATVTNWYEALPSWKKEYFKKIIISAQIFDRLREFGRWLTVKHINTLRNALYIYADKIGLKNKKEIFFATIDEILQERLFEDVLEQRKKTYTQYLDFELPTELTDKPVIITKQMEGVSPGTVRGILVDRLKFIGNYEGKNVIIYSKTLSPDLTKYLGKVVGVISEEGGMLSHFAIIAREQNLPVLVGVDLNAHELKFGKEIEIDASTGKINKL